MTFSPLAYWTKVQRIVGTSRGWRRPMQRSSTRVP